MKINICFSLNPGTWNNILRSYFPVTISWIDIDVAYYLSNNAYYNKRLFISNKKCFSGA